MCECLSHFSPLFPSSLFLNLMSGLRCVFLTFSSIVAMEAIGRFQLVFIY